MEWTAVAETVAPVFALAAVGYLLGAVQRIDLSSLTRIVIYLAGPSLVFSGLSAGPIDTTRTLNLVGGTVVIVIGVGLIVRLFAKATGTRPGALYLPAMFMNAGNMLLPLSLFAFGETGLRHSIIIFVTACVLQSSLGVTIARGRPTLIEMFRLPYIYAVAAAVAVRAGSLEVWPAAARSIELLGDMAIPLMLLALGLRLRSVSVVSWPAAVLVAVARIGGGYAIALLFVGLTGMEGTARSCLLLASVMPSAVINFIFAETYAREPGDVATAVVVSTVVSLVTTPLVLAFGI